MCGATGAGAFLSPARRFKAHGLPANAPGTSGGFGQRRRWWLSTNAPKRRTRFRGLPIEAESLALFCEGTKLAEAPEKARIAALNKAVRQRAAVCMRLGGGGGLFACAILLNLIGGNRR